MLSRRERLGPRPFFSEPIFIGAIMQPADIERETRAFLISNFLLGHSEQLGSNDVLFGKVIDSAGVLELIGFLEGKFSITVPDEDVVTENLGSVSRIAAYVSKRLPATA
jgi:acyl carrier protein